MLERRGIEGREIALAKFAGYPVGVEGRLLMGCGARAGGIEAVESSSGRRGKVRH